MTDMPVQVLCDSVCDLASTVAEIMFYEPNWIDDPSRVQIQGTVEESIGSQTFVVTVIVEKLQ